MSLPGMKRCTKCVPPRDLPVDQFHRNRARPDGRAAYCRDCLNASFKVWRANPNRGLNRPEKRDGNGLVRCQLPRVPNDREMMLVHATDDICGAVLFPRERLQHLAEMHGVSAERFDRFFLEAEPVEDDGTAAEVRR